MLKRRGHRSLAEPMRETRIAFLRVEVVICERIYLSATSPPKSAARQSLTNSPIWRRRRKTGPPAPSGRICFRCHLPPIPKPSWTWRDWICPPEFSEEIHCIIKDSQLRIFEKSSHSIRNDEPELLRETIVDFVGRGA